MKDAKHGAGSGRIGASKFDTSCIADSMMPANNNEHDSSNSKRTVKRSVNKIIAVPLFVLDYAA